MEERSTYDQIRWVKAQAMYEARRQIIRHSREWSSPIEDVAVAYDYREDVTLPPLHELMDNTIYLILCAGQSPEFGFKMVTDEIKSILAKTPLDELLADVPEDEARELRIDLKLLKFID